MSRTDYKTPGPTPHKHDHGLTQADKAIAGKAPLVHAHPEISDRLAALEEAHAVTKALLLSAIGGGVFNPPPPAAPSAPTGVTAAAGDAAATVTWTAPASNGAAITNYEVTPYIDATAQAAVYTGSTATSKTVTGLTNGTAYTFKVAAINSIGTGAQSSASAAVTPTAVPQGGHWTAAFLSYPAAAKVGSSSTAHQLYVGATDVEISNKTFYNLGAGIEAIRFEGCNRIWVHDCDFKNVAQCITVWNSSNVTVEWNRYENIIGPHARTGRNLANFVQLANVSTALVANNKGKGGDTEDICSCYQTDHATFESNHFEGTNWSSESGSGIALGDDGGSYNIARNNVLVNPGQVGAFIAGGTNCSILDNTIIGQQRTYSNVGIYVWNQYASACSGHTVDGNTVNWKNAAGVSNPYWNAGNCGSVTGTNDFTTVLDIESYRVTL